MNADSDIPYCANQSRYSMGIEKIQGIVTDVIRHTDRHNVVTLFTRSRGRVSFVSAAGGGKGGRMRNARLQLFSVIEADVNFRESRDLQLLGSVRPITVWRDLYFNPVKSSIVMFLSDFLNRYLRDAQPDPLFWDYVSDALRDLDRRSRGLANFHIAFLIGMMNFAGIFPDLTDWETGDWFDMRAGLTVAEKPLHSDCLEPCFTDSLPILLRMSLNNCHLYKFNSSQRGAFLHELLHYYGIHFPGLNNLKTLDILSELWR